MTVHLLDVNVLLALFDRQHMHYETTHRWLTANRQSGWATCPITESGFIRISSHPKYPTLPGEALLITGMLMEFCDDPNHQFWAADVRLADIVKPGLAFTHGQVTDIYLLGLAIRKGGKLATLDRRIAAALVDHGVRALTVIPT